MTTNIEKDSFKTIYLLPVPRPSAQGRNKQVYSVYDMTGQLKSSKVMQKSREIGTKEVLKFDYNPETDSYNTGLDELVPNPYFKNDKLIVEKNKYFREQAKDIATQEKIDLQTIFEIEDNKPIDFYTSRRKAELIFRSIFSMNKTDIDPSVFSFVENLKVELDPNGFNKFTDNTVMGRLKIQLLKNSCRVAPSLAEANPNIHSFYIAEENESYREKLAKEDKVDDAIFKLRTLYNTRTKVELGRFAGLLLDRNNEPIVRGEINEDKIKLELGRYIKDSGKNQEEYIDRFNKLYTLVTGNNRESAIKFHIMYLVRQAMNIGVIGIRDNKYTWFSQSEQAVNQLGSEFDTVVAFFSEEYEKYNDKSKSTNYYKILEEELKSKNISTDILK